MEKCFFAYNDGLRRRFNFRYNIPKYNHEELTKIFLKKINDNKWQLDDSVSNNEYEQLYEIFKSNYKNFPHFGGDMESLFFATKIAHSQRIFGKHPKLRKIITLDDIKNGYLSFIGHRKTKEDTAYLNMYM